MAESLILLVEEFKRLERKKKMLGKISNQEAVRLEQLRLMLSERLSGGDSSNRRQELRVAITNLRVRYRAGETFAQNYIHNLSTGGVFISTPKPLPLNTHIKLHLAFEDLHREIDVEGTVVWESTPKQTPFHDDSKTGMGVKFTKVPAEARDIIDDIIHKALTKQAASQEADAKKEDKDKDGKPKKKL